ncbi:unnamed protein product, partial [Discosporangium mesarthrocarpum]
NLSYSTASSGGVPAMGEGGKEGGGERETREVPAWIVEELPGLMTLLEACRTLIHVRTHLYSKAQRGQKVATTRPNTRGDKSTPMSPVSGTGG